MVKDSREYFLHPTVGYSMYPTIRCNEYIIAKRVLAEKISLGQIVIFTTRKRSNICHRVTKIEQKDNILWFHTKGDNLAVPDTAIRQEKIIGKVVAVKRKRAIVALSASGPWIFSRKLNFVLPKFFA